jgi:hypothetical protein
MLFGKIGITSIIGEDVCEMLFGNFGITYAVPRKDKFPHCSSDMLFGKLGITFAKQYPQARLDLDRS